MSEPTQQHDASKLESGYTSGHRTYELCGMALAVSMTAWLTFRIAQSPSLSGWWMPLAGLVGILLADFTSGLFHWGFDTWGGVDTPIVGKLAIRTFRHHHVDQKAITRHDFIETNGHNITLTVIYSAVGFYVFRGGKEITLVDVFIGQFLVCATFFTGFTSQIHKWAHQDNPSKVVRFLQRTRIILDPTHHSKHHSAPYNRNYCITVGWLNGPLRWVRFFETLERTITAITGAIPRVDDIGEDAAVAVAVEENVVDAPDAAPAKVTTRE
jgi:ubiquitin-conjugating enzyme E2 variant